MFRQMIAMQRDAEVSSHYLVLMRREKSAGHPSALLYFNWHVDSGYY
jgi:hypothetical protein